jgi:uncharacterized protein involved in exopolysaccharide biosynthesis
LEQEKSHHTEVEINLIDYLIVLLKWKRLIAGIVLSSALITVLAGFAMPMMYRAETRILPPQQMNSGMASLLMGQVSGSLTGLSGMFGVGSQADLYVSMLQSRTVQDNIIKRFDLKNQYDVKTFEDARKRLNKKTNVMSDPKSNVIVISVEDKGPQKAADMANAFVEELQGMTKTLALTEAAQRRAFFEEQLKDTKLSLIKAEENLKGFQERTGTLHVDEQVKAVIKNISQLRAEIASREVEIKVVKTYSKPGNPDLQKAETALNGMKAELAKLESKNGTGNDPMMPTGRMPSVGTEYVRKLRELKFNETLYDLLLKQYEVAKLDEARDAAVIQTIDKAVAPEKKIKPQKAAMVLAAVLVSSVFSIIAAFFMEQREKTISQPGHKTRMEKLKKYATS